jgi:single stranded DNA-binding protein
MGNAVYLSGRCGKDPDVKEVGSKGTKIATFSMATSEKVGNDWVSEWHNIKCWRKAADKVQAALRKGDLVFIDAGKLTTESWEDRTTGKKVYRTFVVVNFAQQIAIEAPAQESENYHKPQPGTYRTSSMPDEECPF